MLWHVRITSIVLVGLVTSPFSGCGSGADRTRVAGKVTYEGAPIENGMIEFYPVSGTGGPSTGAAIQQGEYEIPAEKGPFVGGTYQVRITSLQKSGKKFVDRDRPQQRGDVLINVIPAQYNSASELTVTFNSDGSRQQDFDLQAAASEKRATAK